MATIRVRTSSCSTQIGMRPQDNGAPALPVSFHTVVLEICGEREDVHPFSQEGAEYLIEISPAPPRA